MLPQGIAATFCWRTVRSLAVAASQFTVAAGMVAASVRRGAVGVRLVVAPTQVERGRCFDAVDVELLVGATMVVAAVHSRAIGVWWMVSPRSRFGGWRVVLPYVVSVLIGLLCAEAALRLVGARFATSFYVVDPDLGWALRPGADGHYTEEAVVPIHINSQGMRDAIEHSTLKRAGSYRVAILGDSFAESMQVPLEQSFPKLMEQDLKSCGLEDPEVLNFGVQGYGTAQELLTWRLRASQFKPDFVILLFYTGNDLYNNHRRLNPTNADAAPYFVMVDGKPVLQPALAKPGPLREVWATAARYSRLAQFLTDAFYKVSRTSTPKNTAEFGEGYMDRLIYAPPKHVAMEEAWAVTEALLPVVRDEVGGGSRFLLALASSGVQVHPEERVRQEFLKFVGGTDLFYTENRLAQVAAGNGIRTVDLGQAMLQQANGTRTFFHGFPGNTGKGHWNTEGHRFVSRELAKQVCSDIETK
jgi:lysophospholipase L1-like esterase